MCHDANNECLGCPENLHVSLEYETAFKWQNPVKVLSN